MKLFFPDSLRESFPVPRDSTQQWYNCGHLNVANGREHSDENHCPQTFRPFKLTGHIPYGKLWLQMSMDPLKHMVHVGGPLGWPGRTRKVSDLPRILWDPLQFPVFTSEMVSPVVHFKASPAICPVCAWGLHRCAAAAVRKVLATGVTLVHLEQYSQDSQCFQRQN